MQLFQKCFILITFLISLGSTAAETVIKGSLKNFEGKTIRAAKYTNYITYEKIWLDQAVLSESNFNLTFDLEHTTQIVLRLEDKETILFAEPGKVYNLNLSYNAAANEGNAFDKLLDLSFPFPTPDNINLQIKSFNKAFQDFFSANYQLLAINAAGKQINAFVEKWEKKNESQPKDFVKQYIGYTLANLQDINGVPKEKLYKEYLSNKPILHANKEYMNFFKQFYQQDFELLTLKKDALELLNAIMIENDLDKTIGEIKRLKQFERQEMAEMYLLNGLYEVYHTKTINQKSSMKLLNNLEEKGTTEEIRNLSTSIISQLQQFEKGGEAAAFALKNSKGELIELKDFKGKTVYLNFWANWSIPSLRELKVLQKLEEKYGDKIHFVSINLDEDASIFKNIKAKNNYDWAFLHYGDDFELREKYDVRTVPTYYLIDAAGKIIKANASGPTEIERTLYDLSK